MKVLVTGASGFVGGVLCRRLARDGWTVRAASRKPGARTNEPGIEWIEVRTVGHGTDWTAALSGVSHVVHLAAVAHQVGARQTDEQTMREVNVRGAVRLAEAAARSGVGRFVYLSSIGAVCSSAPAMVSEGAVLEPDTIYGRSKRDAEEGIRNALSGTRTELTILRPPLVYGPGNPGNMERLLRAVRKGIPLPLGAIQNRRSFLFINNLCDAIVIALTHPNAKDRTFHVSDREIVSTPDLIRAIAVADGKEARVFGIPAFLLRAVANFADGLSAVCGRSGRAVYSLQRLSGSLMVDSSAIRNELGWTQTVSLQEGLKATLNPPAKAGSSA